MSINAWLVRIGPQVRLEGFTIKIDNRFHDFNEVGEGDGFLFVEERDLSLFVVAFARIFRRRLTLKETTFYFDGLISVNPGVLIAELEIPAPLDVFGRLDWQLFENTLKKTCGIDFASLPVLTGSTTSEQAYMRDLLHLAVADDLLGPANGPTEEIIGMSVRDRYLVGKLSPVSPSAILESDELKRTTDEAKDDKKPSAENLKPFEGHHQPGEEFASSEGTTDSDADEKEDSAMVVNQSLVPSSMGFTFCVEGEVEDIEVLASWGRYERTESESTDEKTGKPFRCWKRIPSGGTVTVSLKERKIGSIVMDENCPEVVVQGSVSAPLQNGDRLVTIFLVNQQTKPEENQDSAWIFQPEVIVRDKDRKPIFRKRPFSNATDDDPERESLEMIYRQKVEFAVGHGVSVHAEAAREDFERAIEIETVVLPRYEVPVTETPGSWPEDRPVLREIWEHGALDMEKLATFDKDALLDNLKVLVDDYALWIGERKKRIGVDVKGFDQAATNTIQRCENVLERLKEGISVLGSDVNALEAFRFANRAMAAQRVHSLQALSKRRGENKSLAEFDVPVNRTWRPFQIAFILLAIPGLTDPTHKDRTEPGLAIADLLWFPTGGGKTEAYLGIAAFTMAIRRLQGNLGGLDAGRGLSVIMRYTLRLLTVQQFQRATALICAMEVARRKDPGKWGNNPFTIGLWVGVKVTPNTTKESHEAIQAMRGGRRPRGSSPALLGVCPWCGAEIREGSDVDVDMDRGRTSIYCSDRTGNCDFGRRKSPDMGLPVQVVDEEIYHRPPSMMIATVDKFAMMAWKGEIRTLFGLAAEECERHGLLWAEAECRGSHHATRNLPATTVRHVARIRPPDLIIQDEFHLISGPLGTMVGLYETAVDELSTWKLDGKDVRPKIIASTATVKKADAQVRNVFLRTVSVFPPHGLDIGDDFFSTQRPIEKIPGRLYLGICSPGSSRPAVLIRVYVALLTAAQALFERFGIAADPYMTVVGYFNSLRELGGMRRLAEDDVQTRSYRVLMSRVERPGLAQRKVTNVDELTSRVANNDIPRKLDQLEVGFRKIRKRGDPQGMDIVLATNMFSVGVDVRRLGLMVVNGQPKNTAEYIQSTSRIGRFFPGLVCTVLTWARPRDLSHYETFEHYHATFYKHVEAQSVTPFSPRALDRGLTGMMVSLLRLGQDHLNPNLGAAEFKDSTRPEVATTKRVISDRAWKAKNKSAGQNAETMLSDRMDRWVKEAVTPGRQLGYETGRRQGVVAALLKKPSSKVWDELTAPMSMREVEPGVQLIMDDGRLPDSPQWKAPPKPTSSQGGAR